MYLNTLKVFNGFSKTENGPAIQYSLYQRNNMKNLHYFKIHLTILYKKHGGKAI